MNTKGICGMLSRLCQTLDMDEMQHKLSDFGLEAVEHDVSHSKSSSYGYRRS